MTPDELVALHESAGGVAARHWGPATAAGTGKLGEVWAAGEAQGWFDIGADDDLAAVLTVIRALGAVACPLPVMDAFVARSGGVLVSTAPEHLDGADEATRFLKLPEGTLHEISERTEQPGLAAPPWSAVRLGPPIETREIAEHAGTLLRLGLATRALAAAQRAHEMAIEHSKTRRQFGRPIGSFGAVQQRVAACQIDVSAGNHLIDRAAEAYAAKRPDWPLQAEIAVEFTAAAARRVQLGAHHTLAAIGYFEEHEAPWLFRRVHADTTRLHDLRPERSVADVLVETGAGLPALDNSGDGRFRREVRDLIATTDDATIADEMAARGWFGMGWPASAGGRDASLADQVALFEESTYARAPVTLQLGSVLLLGGSILRHGTAAQQDAFLPLIRAGKLRFCLGYSEPEAGSDLASLKTRADRDGDGWVVNGQKLWTTGGHQASHVWLATRTDQQASPPHAGITVFLVPMDTPGITVHRHTALSGEISCTVFYDGVRIPDEYRVGEVNGGWKVITDALAGERVLMGGIAASLLRQWDDLLDLLRAEPGLIGPRGDARRARLGELAVTLQANRALVAAAIGATADGRGARLEAPMAGVLGGELAEQFGEAMLDILGPRAALTGDFEYGLRLSIMYVVGGGTNDIQRGLIARGLGLPR